KTVALAQTQSRRNPHGRMAHVGYYLIHRGRPALERLTHARTSLRAIAARIGRHSPLLLYLVSVLLIACAATAAFMAWGHRHGAGAALFWLLVPAALCALHLGVALTNWLA